VPLARWDQRPGQAVVAVLIRSLHGIDVSVDRVRIAASAPTYRLGRYIGYLNNG
jgi:hypothetical protein